jgi:hypothetical protein
MVGDYMTNLQLRTFIGFDRSGGRSGIRWKSRLSSSQNPEALEALKSLRKEGQNEISAIEAAKILGGGYKRFAGMVNDGKLLRGAKKLMVLDSLITWVAKGVAQESSRTRDGVHGELDWMRED